MALPGEDQLLSVSVRSTLPFGCQWLFLGSPIPGATTTNLTLSNFGVAQSGLYSVVVSNAYGANWATIAVRLTNSPVVSVDGVSLYGGSTSRVDRARITMANTGTGAVIHYTLGGTDPDFTSIRYTAPFMNTTSALIRAIAYNAAYTNWAEAAPVFVEIWPTYPLLWSTPGGGSISCSPAPYSSTNRWMSDSVVTLTATASNGWTFLRWAGDSTATTNVTSILLDRPKAATAIFGTPLSLFTNGTGHVLVDPPVAFHDFGSTARVSAIPVAGRYFYGWVGTASGSANPLDLRITTATPQLTALFAALQPNQVSLTALPSGNGTITVNPARLAYSVGEIVTVTATPASNQVFIGWSGDAAGVQNPITLTLDTSKLVTATFQPTNAVAPPQILQSPASVTVEVGSSASFQVVASGTLPLAYQWRKAGAPLAGATASSFRIAAVNPADAGSYDAIVTNAFGAVTSAVATLSVTVSGRITTIAAQPGGLILLEATGRAGGQLLFSTSTNLFDWLPWMLLPNPSGTLQVFDPTALPPRKFYRVESR